MEELLRKLNLNLRGEIEGGIYTITISSYDEFSSLYNKLEQSEDISKDSNESYFNMDEAHVIYLADEYDLILNADLSSDIYKLTIEEVKEEENG